MLWAGISEKTCILALPDNLQRNLLPVLMDPAFALYMYLGFTVASSQYLLWLLLREVMITVFKKADNDQTIHGFVEQTRSPAPCP